MILILINTQQNSPKRKDISYSNQNKPLATVKLERKNIWLQQSISSSLTLTSILTHLLVPRLPTNKQQKYV